MQQPILILFPQQPLKKTVDFSTLLTDAQFIGDRFEFKQQTHYLIGQQFFQHIMFVGSPSIKTKLLDDINNDVNFCHIEIISQSEPQFFRAHKIRPPRCPYCQYEVHDWKAVIQKWKQDKMPFICPECHQLMLPTEFDWRNKAGFAHDMISIWGVFDGEAVPNFGFLFQLQQWTGVNWQYCHATGERF